MKVKANEDRRSSALLPPRHGVLGVSEGWTFLDCAVGKLAGSVPQALTYPFVKKVVIKG